MSKLVVRKDQGLNEGDKRLNPDIMSLALLDEIADTMFKVRTFMESQSPTGIVEPIEPVTVTSTTKVVNPIKPWFSVDIVNDGPNSVYVLVNPERSFDWHEVRAHETYRVEMGHAIITSVLLKCDPNLRATARLIGTR